MRKAPRFKHYDNSTPCTLIPYPKCTLLDYFTEALRERPDHPFLLFKNEQMSYAELEKLSNIFAHSLNEQGVKKGDYVVLLLPKCPQSIISQLGVWKIGAIAVPLNPLYTERELEHLLLECEAETAVVLTPFYSKVKSVQPRTNLKKIIVTNIKEYLPSFSRLMNILLQERKEEYPIILSQEDFWLNDLLQEKKNIFRPPMSVNYDDPALLLFTGGTTGAPKGVVGTHRALVIAGIQLHTWFGFKLVDWEDIVTLTFPLFHVAGNVGIFATSLIGHNPLAIISDSRDIDDLITTINEVHPAFLLGVPTFFASILNHPDVKSNKVNFKSIKLCISGGAKLQTETKELFETKTGLCVIDVYALTESIMAGVISPITGNLKSGAVGVPLPDVEIRIANMHTGKGSLPFGEVGEILIRAPQIMESYWKINNENRGLSQKGWLHSGDVGYLDKDGYLFIVDRKKDMIKPSGFQVWPSEIEEVISSHPAVIDVSVAGVPDNYQGEAVKAWIVTNPENKVTDEEIKAYCHGRLAPYKIPKYVEFRENLPKTVLGKASKQKLIDEDLI